MAASGGDLELEAQLAEWRAHLRRRPAIAETDAAALEVQLRREVEALTGVGLAADEAFLVALKRIGAGDARTREFARRCWDRRWQERLPTPEAGAGPAERRREAVVALALAFAAATLIKLPELFGYSLQSAPELYARNASLLVFPLVAGYFAWKRGLTDRAIGALAATFVLAALVINLYPFRSGSDTLVLAVLHLPIGLWLAVGVSHTGGEWSDGGRRMGFVRFSGELFIHYVLIALGGGVLTAFTLGIFASIGADASPFVTTWLLPCGAAGAVVVASWLVDAKQGVLENLAPLLSRLFTPLFTAVLVTFLATMAWTGRGIGLDRDVLIAFDLVLALVLGLLLYAISARDPEAPAGVFDWLLVLLVIAALLVDALALASIVGRISDFGFTPNRVAALGENVVLLVNLAWSAWLYGRFLRGRGSFRAVEKWQTDYLPVYAAWAALVVVLFPPLFRFG